LLMLPVILLSCSASAADTPGQTPTPCNCECDTTDLEARIELLESRVHGLMQSDVYVDLDKRVRAVEGWRNYLEDRETWDNYWDSVLGKDWQ